MNSVKKLFFAIFAIQPLFIVAAVIFYTSGIKEYGDPVKYREEQLEILKAVQDSIRTQMSVVSPENMGDSTMVGMEKHISIFEDTRRYEEHMKQVKATIDSLQQESTALVEISNNITEKKKLLESLSEKRLDENIISLAKIYNSMIPEQSVPLIISTNDTTAVLIILNMEESYASVLLGLLAETDLEKATRISNLLAILGTLK